MLISNLIIQNRGGSILPWAWLDRLAFVPDGVSKPMAYSRPKGPRLRLGHLRVGELQH